MEEQLITYKDMRPEAVVLANGDFPTHPLPLRLLAEASCLVCCDGGANACIAAGYMPHLIIGDGDSLSTENQEKYASLLIRVTEQETNDQTKAVTHLLKAGKRHICILGATGKREDHALGNISLLADYLQAGAEVRTYTDHGAFIPCQDTCTFACRPGQQVSIINFTACGLQEEGLVYPLRDFTNWWQGTLNECTGNRFTIRAKGVYLVFMAYLEDG